MDYTLRPPTTMTSPRIQAATTLLNMSLTERRLSIFAGVGVGLIALRQRNLLSLPLAALSLSLLYQGVTGESKVNELLGRNSAVISKRHTVSVPHQQGIHEVESITIDRLRLDLYAYWRDLTNLPKFMTHIESIEPLPNGHTYWIAKGPAGMSLEWEAEIHNDVPGEVIAWRSVNDARVPNAGSVRFENATGNRGTKVTVTVEYAPPGGKLARAIATLFGANPHDQIAGDLQRFKWLMELGEMVSNESPHGPRSPMAVGRMRS